MDSTRTNAGAASPVGAQARPPTAYIVAGPVSSGNRLVAAVLVRSGCAGEANTRQPQSAADLPPPSRPLVIIQHTNLTSWIRHLRLHGYGRVMVVVPIREPVANADSMVRRGHYPDFDAAYAHRGAAIAAVITETLAQQADLEIITYEGLSEPFLYRWLPRIGLPYIRGPLSLQGQAAPVFVSNQNLKHYL